MIKSIYKAIDKLDHEKFILGVEFLDRADYKCLKNIALGHGFRLVRVGGYSTKYSLYKE